MESVLPRSECGSHTAMKALVAFFFGHCFALRRSQPNCWDSQEHILQCLQAGDADVAFTMGNRYDRGEGVDQDFKEAMKWYRLSADHGNPKAQVNIGFLYKEGKGVPQDHAEAFRWYRLAADQGLPRGQAAVGVAYATGEGILQDYSAAVDWCRKAAKQGDASGQRCLRVLYKAGGACHKITSKPICG
jgi:TPR repeat protein